MNWWCLNYFLILKMKILLIIKKQKTKKTRKIKMMKKIEPH